MEYLMLLIIITIATAPFLLFLLPPVQVQENKPQIAIQEIQGYEPESHLVVESTLVPVHEGYEDLDWVIPDEV